MATPVNNDLSYSNGIPGVYVKLDLSGAGSGSDDTLRRVLLMGYSKSTGTAAVDAPIRVTNQSDANTYCGQGSDLARMFLAFNSQVNVGAADVHLCPLLAPTGGTASVYKVVLLFSTGSTAGGSGQITVKIAGRSFSAGISSGDSLSTISTALYNAMALDLDLPVAVTQTQTTSANDTLTLTYNHKGEIGEDLPINVNITGSSNLQASPGVLLFATSAAADGSVTVTSGAITVTAAITSGDISTAIATKVNTALTAGSYPLTSSVSSSTVTLLYANNRDVRRVAAKITTSTTTTINGVAAGSFAYIGTASSTAPGAGVPTLTTALTNIAALPAFGTWVAAIYEAGAASFVALMNHIETYANGYYQKDQHLFVGNPLTGSQWHGVYDSGVNLTLRTEVIACTDSGIQSYEEACRAAGVFMDQNYAAQNFDGMALTSNNPAVPNPLPAVGSRLGDPDQNALMKSYYQTPIVAKGASKVILRGVTSSSSANELFTEWATAKQLAYDRISLRQYLQGLFHGKNFKANSPARTPNSITANSVRDAIYVWAKGLDDQDLFDGADAIKNSISVAQDSVVRSRLNIFVPLVLMRNIHQLGVVASPQ
jgi:phage tail sheath gpL-like